MELLLALSFGVLGAVLASFIGVIAERAYTGESWRKGRSRCDSCAKTLPSYALVPVFSWLLSRGRCFLCGSRVSGRHVIVEGVLGVLFALSYLTLGLTLPLVFFLGALMALTFIVVYDLRHTVVPWRASLLLGIASLGYALSTSFSPLSFGLTLLVAGMIGFGFFLLHYFSKGRAMGLGDAPVALSLSLLVGAPTALPGLLFSFWIGAVIGIFILVRTPRGHRMGIEVPFVPFLAAGYLLAYFTQWNPLFLF